MNLRKAKDRSQFRLRLCEGARQTKRDEALRALPSIRAALESVRSDMASAKARFRVLADTEADDPAQAVSPILASKAATYRHWAPFLLAAEGLIAYYISTLTLIGGFLVHAASGVALTLLMTGVAKANIASQVDIDRWHVSVRALEAKLRRASTIAGALLLMVFFSRFLFFADLVFAVVSSLLSFIVAYLAAITLTLGDLMSASDREIKRFGDLSLLETELTELQALAERLAEDAPPPERTGKFPLTTVGIVALLLVFSVPAKAADLTIWVDTSGSLKPDEFDSLRVILMDPYPLLEYVDAVAIAPFWSEEHSLRTTQRWLLPERTPMPACAGTGTLFTATRKAREAECRKEAAEATELRRVAADRSLVGYRDALAELDVTVEHRQTCLYPILSRIAASGVGHFHIVITDGAHANCGPAPAEPMSCACSAVVVLVPDTGGDGIASRMESRTATLRKLYPGLVVLPSWQVTALDRLFTALTDRLP